MKFRGGDSDLIEGGEGEERRGRGAMSGWWIFDDAEARSTSINVVGIVRESWCNVELRCWNMLFVCWKLNREINIFKKKMEKWRKYIFLELISNLWKKKKFEEERNRILREEFAWITRKRFSHFCDSHFFPMYFVFYFPYNVYITVWMYNGK